MAARRAGQARARRPEAAGRIIAGLLPVQSAIVQGPVDYDLTIAEIGTFAVTVASGRAYVKRHRRAARAPGGRVPPLRRRAHARRADRRRAAQDRPLPRRGAGVGPQAPRQAAAAPSPPRGISLAEAARAGARLEPALVFRTFPYVVQAAWSRGHSFTVAQQIAGDPPETWYISVGNGRGLEVLTTPPEDGADATVTMTPEAFGHLLRGEPVPPGQRPFIRGDRAAVALLKSWLDRAQGL